MAQNFTSIDDLVKKHNELKHGVGSAAKESAPMPKAETGPAHESQETLHTGQSSVQPFIQKRQESIKLPTELKDIGIEATADEESEKLQSIKFPISDDQIMKDLQAPPSESKRWYATFFLYLLERAHLSLKRVGDRVVRVMKFN